jgi:hypothetical protein
MFSSFDLKWSQIERFDIGRSGMLPAVCRVHMKDGRVLRAFGIQESNYSAARRLGAAKAMAEDLNKELAAHKA